MASHHHHHDHGCIRHQNHDNNITSSHCCTQINHPSPPPPEENLLNLIASYLQNQQHETQCPNQTCSCESSFQRVNVIRRQHQQKNVPRQREYDHVVLACLLRKIDDLESSLNKFSACYEQRRDRHSTLRDSAARVIQTHFRSYLVHRSISFRQLKELATIKSSFLSLKTSVSGKSIFPFKLVSRKATDLLLQLDSIQGRIDPMIRRSKRSLSRDLVRFLQYIDDCAIKKFDFVAKSSVSVSSHSKHNGKKPRSSSVAEDRTVEKLRNRMGKIFAPSSEDENNNLELEDMTDDSEEVPKTPKTCINKRKIGSSKSSTGVSVKGNVVKVPVRKSVVLDKNRNVYQVYGNTHDLTSNVEDESVDGDEETLVMSRDNGKLRRNRILVKGSGAKTPRVVKTVSFDEDGNVYKVYVDTSDQTSSGEDDSVDDEEEILVMSRNDGKRHNSKTGNMVLVKGNGGKTNCVVKTVSFDENGNICKVYGDTPEPSISEEDDSTSGSNVGNGQEKGNGNEVKEIQENEGFEEDEEEEEETHSENEVCSSEGSEGDVIVTRDINHPGSNKYKEVHLQKESLMFSPPLPLKMEP